jgi:endonuclease III
MTGCLSGHPVRMNGGSGASDKATVRALLDRAGQTYADQAGIRLRNAPGPLFQLLLLSQLLSDRLRPDAPVASARELFDAGMDEAGRMAGADWQQRVDALGRGGYRRYDESTATRLGQTAEKVLERYGGDLRRLRERHPIAEALREFPGIGPTGVDIFLREAQAVWPEYAPHIDAKVRDGAQRLGLPRSPGPLTRLVGREEVPRFTAGLVRVALDKRLAEEVRSLATR